MKFSGNVKISKAKVVGHGEGTQCALIIDTPDGGRFGMILMYIQDLKELALADEVSHWVDGHLTVNDEEYREEQRVKGHS